MFKLALHNTKISFNKMNPISGWWLTSDKNSHAKNKHKFLAYSATTWKSCGKSSIVVSFSMCSFNASSMRCNQFWKLVTRLSECCASDTACSSINCRCLACLAHHHFIIRELFRMDRARVCVWLEANWKMMKERKHNVAMDRRVGSMQKTDRRDGRKNREKITYNKNKKWLWHYFVQFDGS